jgi:hypothetical protein
VLVNHVHHTFSNGTIIKNFLSVTPIDQPPASAATIHLKATTVLGSPLEAGPDTMALDLERQLLFVRHSSIIKDIRFSTDLYISTVLIIIIQ